MIPELTDRKGRLKNFSDLQDLKNFISHTLPYKSQKKIQSLKMKK